MLQGRVLQRTYVDMNRVPTAGGKGHVKMSSPKGATQNKGSGHKISAMSSFVTWKVEKMHPSQSHAKSLWMKGHHTGMIHPADLHKNKPMFLKQQSQ
jgi:hypothetical protein